MPKSLREPSCDVGAFLYRRLGIIIAVLCIGVSWRLSIEAAYDPALGWTSVLLVAIACVAEPSKLAANRLLWHPESTWLQRLYAGLWYGACILVSIGLMHLLAEKQIAATTAVAEMQKQQDAGNQADWASRRAELRLDLQKAEEAAEEARGQVVPGIRPLSAVQKLLAAPDAPSARERKLLEQELNAAQLNGQREARATRHDERATNLRKSLASLEAERPGASEGRSPDAHVRDVAGVRNVSDSLTLLALLSAIIIEMGVSGGVLVDTVCNRPPAPPDKEVERIQGLDKPDKLGTDAVNAGRFDEWLQREWRKQRGADGWLEGTHREWAAGAGCASPGFVHAQLKRLWAAGIIEKRGNTRKTWIRFVKVAKLKSVK
jgi:hypothetical protein